MTDLGWPELLIVAAIAMMLFGTKKMPDIARSLGRSMRIVKAELGGLKDDTPTPAAPPEPAAAAQPVVVEPVVVEPVVVEPVVVEPVAAPQPVSATVEPTAVRPEPPTR